MVDDGGGDWRKALARQAVRIGLGWDSRSISYSFSIDAEGCRGSFVRRLDCIQLKCEVRRMLVAWNVWYRVLLVQVSALQGNVNCVLACLLVYLLLHIYTEPGVISHFTVVQVARP